jgi:ABC-2 type transport system ATP-binding protein
MIHDPEVLILDEPTTGLDPNQIVEIRELIRKIGREKTVILSSHILAEVEAACDRILIINKGKIVANGTPDQLRQQAKGNEILQVAIKNGDQHEIFKSLQALPTIMMVDYPDTQEDHFLVQSREGENTAKAIFDLCAKNNWYISELTPTKTKLKDIFREVTLN